MSVPIMYDFATFEAIVLDKLQKEARQFKDNERDKSKAKKGRDSINSNSVSGWRLLDHAAFFTSQATAITSNFLSHHLSGPRRPSWPIQLTLLNAIANTVKNHTHLGQLKLLRQITSFANPLAPSDIVITPVSFPVRKFGLNGILRDLDAEEKGNREITGEWVVSRDLWRKINQEYHLSASHYKHIYIDYDGLKWSTEKVILYVHGGAYWLFSAKTHRDITYRLSNATGRRVFAVNYGLAPENPFPYGLHDAVHAFLYLIDSHGLAIQPQNILVAGDSAGGGLSLALLLYLRDNHMPMPGGAILFSPWCDLTMSCASWDHNEQYDFLFKPSDDEPLHPVKFYLSPYEERSYLVTNPYVSPIFAELDNLPPLLIQCGEAEVLHDEICLIAYKASQTGTTYVQHEIYEDMIHVFQQLPFLGQTRKAFESVAHFVENILPVHQKSTLLSQPWQRSFSPSELPVQMPSAPKPLSDKTPPTKCDKSTSTDEDGIIPSKLQPIPSNSAKDPPLKQARPTLKPLRSTSHPDMRKLFMSYAENPDINTNFIKANNCNHKLENNEDNTSVNNNQFSQLNNE